MVGSVMCIQLTLAHAPFFAFAAFEGVLMFSFYEADCFQNEYMMFALADPGGGPGGPGPPLTPRFGGPGYTIWRPSVQFKG